MADLRRKAAAAAVLAASATLAVGCGGTSRPGATTHATSRAAAAPKCTLSPRQRRVVRRAKHMISDMHRLDMRLKTSHRHGPMKLELELNDFLLAIGPLPLNQRSLLIRKAKSAVGLCRDCFDALEAEEPALQPSNCKLGL